MLLEMLDFSLFSYNINTNLFASWRIFIMFISDIQLSNLNSVLCIFLVKTVDVILRTI